MKKSGGSKPRKRRNFDEPEIPAAKTASKLDILKLPFLPLLKIIRFLDFETLFKLQKTNQTARAFIEENRLHLVWKVAQAITVHWETSSRSGRTKFCVGFVHNICAEKYLRRRERGSTSTLFIIKHTNQIFKATEGAIPFFTGFARRFRNTKIRILDFQQTIPLTDDELRQLPRLLEQNKLVIEGLQLCLREESGLDSTARFIKALSPEHVYLINYSRNEDLTVTNGAESEEYQCSQR